MKLGILNGIGGKVKGTGKVAQSEKFKAAIPGFWAILRGESMRGGGALSVLRNALEDAKLMPKGKKLGEVTKAEVLAIRIMSASSKDSFVGFSGRDSHRGGETVYEQLPVPRRQVRAPS